MGATLGATRTDNIAAARTLPDDDRKVTPHGRIDLNAPGTPLETTDQKVPVCRSFVVPGGIPR